MTAVGQWRATYEPGEWLVLSGPTSLVMVDGGVAEAGLLEALWSEVLAAGSMSDLAGRLAQFGRDDVPSFAALFWTPDGLRSLVRGAVRVHDAADGRVVADGDGIVTWTEAGLGGVTAVRVRPGESDATPAGAGLPLVVGAVRAGSVLLDASPAARVESPQAVPAPPVADGPPEAEPEAGSEAAPEAEPEPEPDSAAGAEPDGEEESALAAPSLPSVAPVPVPAAPVALPVPPLVGAPVALPAPVPPAGQEVHWGDWGGAAAEPALPAPEPVPSPADPAPSPAAAEQAASAAEPEDEAPEPEEDTLEFAEAEPEAEPESAASAPAEGGGAQPAADDPGDPPTELLPPGAPLAGLAGRGPVPAPPLEPAGLPAVPPWADAPAAGPLTPPQPVGPPEPFPGRPPLEPPASGLSAAELAGIETGDTQLMMPAVVGPAASGGPGAGGGGEVLAVLCPYGHPSAPGAQQCRVCGQPLAPQTPRPVAPPLLAVLRSTDGTTAPLDRAVLVGRAPSADRSLATAPRLMVVPSPGHDISRTHLEVTAADWQVLVTDLHSTNGTILVWPGGERQPLPPGQAVPVPLGAALELGDGITVLVDFPQ